jgi:formate dehydrogenase subunit gamma
MKQAGIKIKQIQEDGNTILRFQKAEIMVHWAIAIPFLICFVTAAILAFVFYWYPLHPLRSVVSWIHRLSGVGLIVLPIVAMVRGRKQFSTHLDNIRQAWVWAWDDIKWLALMGLAAISKRFTLPEQGKFNAAEKLNFMMVMTTWPLYGITGILIWLPGIAFTSWMIHISMAVLAAPLIFGHIFMAAVNPASKVGLPGMFTGYVDREWAEHHYTRWFRENFEESPLVVGSLKCEACEEHQPVYSWSKIIRESLEGVSNSCPGCGTERALFQLVLGEDDPMGVEEILEQIEASMAIPGLSTGQNSLAGSEWLQS